MSNTDTTTALVTRAVLRDFRATPQKARRVVNLVRGQRADNALNMMKFANQPELGAAIYSLIASAAFVAAGASLITVGVLSAFGFCI